MNKVVHIITGLNLGGAETMLYKLLKNNNRKKYSIEVISLIDKGYYGSKIEDLGIKVHEINMGRIPSVKNIKYIRNIVRNANIVQTWMYHANFIGYIVTRFNNVDKLIWGIRTTHLNKNDNKTLTLIIAKINSILSKKIDLIISCSIKAKKTHIDLGYCKEKLIVIPNGFELNKIYFNEDKRNIIRNKLSLSNKLVLINIGRWNKAKDHRTLIKAYKKIENNNNHLLLIGPNITQDNIELIELIKEYNIKNYTLLGSQSDINSYLSASDIYVSSSKNEGFPNVIGEAMAAELPCVVTDAGDSRYLVGNSGMVVPIGDVNELATKLQMMTDMPSNDRINLGKLARKRIKENFDIKIITQTFETHY